MTDQSICEKGKCQSPVALAASAEKGSGIQFQFQPMTGMARDTGSTIQVDVTDNAFSLGGTQYAIQQFHFHHPAEHFIEAHQFAMELHFVGAAASGEYAVVGVFIEEGQANPLIEKLWTQKPVSEINLAQLLPSDQAYYTYPGSLTTPPYTEGIRWLVLQHPITFSEAQIQQFSDWFSDNARPLQPLNDRVVKLVSPTC